MGWWWIYDGYMMDIWWVYGGYMMYDPSWIYGMCWRLQFCASVDLTSQLESASLHQAFGSLHVPWPSYRHGHSTITDGIRQSMRVWICRNSEIPMKVLIWPSTPDRLKRKNNSIFSSFEPSGGFRNIQPGDLQIIHFLMVSFHHQPTLLGFSPWFRVGKNAHAHPQTNFLMVVAHEVPL